MTPELEFLRYFAPSKFFVAYFIEKTNSYKVDMWNFEVRMLSAAFDTVEHSTLFKLKFMFIYSHLFNYNTTTIRKKRSLNRANYTLN